MARDSELLFYDGDLRATIEAHFQKVNEKVAAIPEPQFLATEDDLIIEHVVADFQVTPLELHEDAAQMEQEETRVDVTHTGRYVPRRDGQPTMAPGQRITVSIPFRGDRILWKLRPSSWHTSFPHGIIRSSGDDLGGFLDIVMELPSDCAPEQFKQHLDYQLRDVRFYLEKQNPDIEQLNNALPNKVRQIVQARRARLEAHGKVREVLNIPLKKKPGAPDVSQIPIRRKLVKPLPPTPDKPAEPGIRDEDYEHILGVIRHEGRTFETTPATYAVHDEEELRDIMLAHLNGHYQGDATGETFRGAGKTDIRIESDNRAAFVAECKVWRGPKEAVAAVEQLLGYLTWRDCKTALVIFNKDVAGFAAIQEKLGAVLRQHELCERALNISEPGEWRFRFRTKQDPGRYITLHVFLFNLFSTDAS